MMSASDSCPSAHPVLSESSMTPPFHEASQEAGWCQSSLTVRFESLLLASLWTTGLYILRVGRVGWR